jgi:hypothetical protein
VNWEFAYRAYKWCAAGGLALLFGEMAGHPWLMHLLLWPW